MNRMIIIECTNRGNTSSYWLDFTMGGRTVSLLKGEKERMLGIAEEIKTTLDSIDSLEKDYELELHPFDEEHFNEGKIYAYLLKEEDGTTDSKDSQRNDKSNA